MKKFRFAIGFAVTAALLGSSLAIASPVGAAAVRHARPAASKITVGLVTDKGGLNDKSFNHLADVGLKAAIKKLGVKGAVLQSHSSADYEPNLTKFAQEKKSLVIAVGFLMENALYHVALQYPKIHFAIIDGAPANDSGNQVNLKNVANLFFKPEQSGYLVGVIAGELEKEKLAPNYSKNTVASIAGANFLAVTAYNCGYQEGVWSVDPSAKVLAAYDDGTFSHPLSAEAIGKTQIQGGAGILFQVDGGAGLGYLAAAQAANVWGIGVDADQDYLGSYVITSALKKVDEAVYLTIHDLTKHHFPAGNNYFSLKNGATGYATDTHHVPASIKKIAAAKAKLIASGKIKVNPVCTLGSK